MKDSQQQIEDKEDTGEVEEMLSISSCNSNGRGNTCIKISNKLNASSLVTKSKKISSRLSPSKARRKGSKRNNRRKNCSSNSTSDTNNTEDDEEDNDDNDSDGEDPMGEFLPLDAVVSCASEESPPAIELIQTQDIPTVRVSLKQSFIGVPLDKMGPGNVQQQYVRKSGKKITRKSAQYALTAGMILGIRECVGGVDDAELRLDMNKNINIIRNNSGSVTSGKSGNNNGGTCSGQIGNENTENCSVSEHDENNGSLHHAIDMYLSNRKLLKSECARVLKYEFPPNLLLEDSRVPYSYSFKCYAPRIFAHIRSRFGVNKQLFLHSICGKFNFVEFMSNAKSGNFFFFSHDGRYMIKTQTNEECKFMMHILPDYYEHLMKHPHSFLSHFYGMYRVKILETGQNIHFMIMKSVFNTECEIHKIWDLKGSKQNRRAKPGELVYKDLDIMEEKHKIRVGNETKFAFMNQLRSDTNFLTKMGIMDYSLLLGVHDTLEQHEEPNHGNSNDDHNQEIEHSDSNINHEDGDHHNPLNTPDRNSKSNLSCNGDGDDVSSGLPGRTNTPLRRRHHQRNASNHQHTFENLDYVQGMDTETDADDNDSNYLGLFGSDNDNDTLSLYSDSTANTNHNHHNMATTTNNGNADNLNNIKLVNDDSTVDDSYNLQCHTFLTSFWDDLTFSSPSQTQQQQRAQSLPDKGVLNAEEEKKDSYSTSKGYWDATAPLHRSISENFFSSSETNAAALKNHNPLTAASLQSSASAAQQQHSGHMNKRRVRSCNNYPHNMHNTCNPYSSRDDLGIETDPALLQALSTSTSKKIYFCGIIDILQYYNTRKLGETVVKKAAGNSASEISCVDPQTYANRFLHFISDLLE